jgi:organic hydroperoxide reductase OsmC/OhrA
MTTTPQVHEFDVTVDADRTARSALGGSAVPTEPEWWAEHLMLAGLVRCTLTSLDHHVRRAELEATGAGSAHGIVTKRDEDGCYALVDVEVQLDVELTPTPDPDAVRELLARAERGCFVGNSLVATPRYSWTVNGEVVTS